MPAPINVDAANAIDVGSLPANITQNVHDSGTTYTVWYKYTAQAGDNMIGVWGYGDFSAYQPVVSVKTPDGATSYVGLSASRERPMQFGVTVGQTYYFQCNKGTTGNPSPASLTLKVDRFTDTTVPAGSIGVNDERGGLAAMFVSASVDYTTLRFVQGIANGDFGAQLTDGTIALDNGNVASNIKIYDTSMNVLATVARAINTGSMTSNRADAFYFLASGTATPTVQKCGTDGTILDTFHPTGGFFNTMCVSPDDTILYYTTIGSDIIRRWDLATDTALSDLVTLASVPNQTEMLCLSDGSVLALLPGSSTVVRYSAAGALLTTYTMPAGTVPGFVAGNRLAHDNVDDTHFWVRDHQDPDFNKFWKFNVASGAIVVTREHASFWNGVYGESNADITPTPLARFGVAESCPMWMTVASFPDASTGSVLVIKQTVPSNDATSFDFTADAPLSPTSFALAHDQSQSYNSVAAGSGYSVQETANPIFVTTYVVSTGEDPTDFTVTAGEVTTITVTNRRLDQLVIETETRLIRRQRTTPIVSANGLRLKHKLLQIDLRTGVGLPEGQGSNPLVMLQVSHDGGQTWSNERFTSAGALGRYLRRAMFYRNGVGRATAYRVTVSDPVAWQLVAAYIDLEEGLS